MFSIPQLLISTQALPMKWKRQALMIIRLDMKNTGFGVLGARVAYDKAQRLITSPDPKF